MSLSRFYYIEAGHWNNPFYLDLWYDLGKMIAAKAIGVETSYVGVFVFRWFPLALSILSILSIRFQDREKNSNFETMYIVVLFLYVVWWLIHLIMGHLSSGAYIQLLGIVFATRLWVKAIHSSNLVIEKNSESAAKEHSSPSFLKGKFLPFVKIATIVLIVVILSFFLLKKESNSADTDNLPTKTHTDNSESTNTPLESSTVEVILNIGRVESSGEYKLQNKVYSSKNMIDGNFGTWWTPDPSNGVQSFATFYLENYSAYEVSSLKIINGSPGKYYYDNSRISKIKLSFEDGESEYVNLVDKEDYQTIQFEKKHKTSSIKLEIVDKITGRNWDDVCIAEVQILGTRMN
jgi:hypothetical protein